MEKRLSLRLPEELYAWLSAYAEAHDRSMNAQLVAILRQERRFQARLRLENETRYDSEAGE